MKSVIMLWYRIFKVLKTEKAERLELTPSFNIYGDAINRLNCRSIWIDKKGNQYRVEELYIFE